MFEINHALGMEDIFPGKNPPRNSEMRAIMTDFLSKYKKEFVQCFRDRRREKSEDFIDSSQVCWLFFDMFSRENGLKFMRKEGEVEIVMQRDNSQQFFAEKLHHFLFDYIKLDSRYHPDVNTIPISFDFFWTILYYLLETKSVQFEYIKPGVMNSNDTKESLRKTLEEYKSKYEMANDLQVQAALQHTIDFLQEQIDKLNEPQRKAESKLKETEGNWKKALREIFLFYSKQQKAAKTAGTFDGYRDDNKTMSAGEWLMFCKDFDLIPENWKRSKATISVEEKAKYEKLCKEVNKQVLNQVYKLESVSNIGIQYEPFEKILKTVCLKVSDVYGFTEEKIYDMFSKMGLLDGSYKDKMKQMNKPFFNALHYPALMPHMKEEKPLPLPKFPNLNVNQQVFNRLYDRALAENQTKQIIHNLTTNPVKNMIVINKNTGMVEMEEGGFTRLDDITKRESAPRSALGKLRETRPPANDLRIGLRNGLESAANRRQGGPVSYAMLEKNKGNQVDARKKVTWENLEKMNVSELKGYSKEAFDPASLIGNEDEEDKVYMQELATVTEVSSHRPELDHKVKVRKIQAYGGIVGRKQQSDLGSVSNFTTVVDSVVPVQASPQKKQQGHPSSLSYNYQ